MKLIIIAFTIILVQNLVYSKPINKFIEIYEYNDILSYIPMIDKIKSLSVYFDEFSLDSIPNSFCNLSNINSIKIHGTYGEGIVKFLRDFRNKETIKKLNISNTNIRNLEELINNFQNIEELIIENCVLNHLSFLQSLKKLKNLELKNCFFHELSSVSSNSDMSKENNVDYLDCSNCYDSLKNLIFNDINIQGIELFFSKLKNLESLELERCNIRHLWFLSNLKNLKNLKFSECPFLELTSFIGEPQKLEKLYLSNLKVNSFPDKITELKQLKKLYIYNIPIEYLTANFRNFTELETLHLYNTKLKNLDFMKDLKNVKTLKLENNIEMDINSVLVAINNSKEKIENLSIEDFSLRHFPDEIFNFNNLRTLSLDNNHIPIIPDKFSQLEKLEMFSICNNDIQTIPSSLVKLENIEELYFYNNNISLIDDILAVQNKSLKVINLYKNPILFNDIKKLQDHFKNTNIIN